MAIYDVKFVADNKRFANEIEILGDRYRSICTFFVDQEGGIIDEVRELSKGKAARVASVYVVDPSVDGSEVENIGNALKLMKELKERGGKVVYLDSGLINDSSKDALDDWERWTNERLSEGTHYNERVAIPVNTDELVTKVESLMPSK